MVSTPTALLCPADDVVHPDAELIDRRTVRWVVDHGLFADDTQRARLAAMHPGRLLARVAPRADVHRLGPVTDFHTWLFAFDDAHCDESDRSPAELARLTGMLLRVVEHPTVTYPGNDPYVHALRDIRLRLGAIASARQLARWTEAVRGYFHHQLWETANTACGTTPDLEDYALIRLANGAMFASITLLDVAEGAEVPQEVLDSPAVRALMEMTALLVGWDNDIFSIDKELKRSTNTHNLLLVLSPTDPYAALDLALRHRDAVMRRFLHVHATVLATADAPTARFLANLASWIHANIAFSVSTTRYRAASPLISGCSATAPELAPVTPPNALSWWWDDTVLFGRGEQGGAVPAEGAVAVADRLGAVAPLVHVLRSGLRHR